MGTKTTALVVLIALAAAAAATAGPPRHAKVMLRSTSLGTVLVDARGRTLYLFEADTRRRARVTGSAPPSGRRFSRAARRPAAGLEEGPACDGEDGRTASVQVVYAGHPLYFFSADARAGQTNGEGIDALRRQLVRRRRGGQGDQADADRRRADAGNRGATAAARGTRRRVFGSRGAVALALQKRARELRVVGARDEDDERRRRTPARRGEARSPRC